MPIPLSELLLDVPLVETEAYIRRPEELREEEWKNRRDFPKMPRPINVFLLYRRAVSERAKEYAGVTNHQIVSKYAAASWKNESDKVKNIFGHYAELEKECHDKAFPGYKFNPKRTQFTKASKGKRKENDREDPNDGDDDPEFLDRNSMRKKKVKIRTRESNSAEQDDPHLKNDFKTPSSKYNQLPYPTDPKYLPYGRSYEQMLTNYNSGFDMRELQRDSQSDSTTLSAATQTGLSEGHLDPLLGNSTAIEQPGCFDENAIDPNLFDINSDGDGFSSRVYNGHENLAPSNLEYTQRGDFAPNHLEYTQGGDFWPTNLKHTQEEEFLMSPSQNPGCEFNEFSILINDPELEGIFD